MSIAFRSVSSTTYASRTNTTVTAPSGIVDGDILVAQIFTGAAATTVVPTFPAGFTVIDHTSVADVGDFRGNFYVAWKRAASESGDYTITHATASSQASILVYSGCIASGSPIDTYSKNFLSGNPVSGFDVSIATSITTSVPNTYLIYTGHNWTNSGAINPPTGFTERLDGLAYVADMADASAGATGNVTQTNGNSTGGSDWAAWLIALLPAVIATSSAYPKDIHGLWQEIRDTFNSTHASTAAYPDTILGIIQHIRVLVSGSAPGVNDIRSNLQSIRDALNTGHASIAAYDTGIQGVLRNIRDLLNASSSSTTIYPSDMYGTLQAIRDFLVAGGWPR